MYMYKSKYKYEEKDTYRYTCVFHMRSVSIVFSCVCNVYRAAYYMQSVSFSFTSAMKEGTLCIVEKNELQNKIDL